MKITNIILTSQNGGAEQVFLDYCRILKDLGHEITAIIKKDAPYAEKLDEIGAKTIKINNKFGYCDIFAIQNIKKALKKFASDAVITHNSRAISLTKKARPKQKQIAVNHSNNVKRSIGCDLIISVNTNIFYKTVDSGQAPEKSITIPNSIEIIEKIKPKTINFNKKAINLGMMARFDHSKGYLEALDALKILKNNQKSHNFNLKIAGDGYFKEKILKKIAENDLKNEVELLGWIKNKEEFFNNIDIFLLPSTTETFGLVLLEAMNYETPIISSDADGPKEILKHQETALIVNMKPSQNYPENLAQTIENMIKNENLAKNIVKNAKNDLKKRFSYQTLQKNLKDIFGAG